MAPDESLILTFYTIPFSSRSDAQHARQASASLHFVPFFICFVIIPHSHDTGPDLRASRSTGTRTNQQVDINETERRGIDLLGVGLNPIMNSRTGNGLCELLSRPYCSNVSEGLLQQAIERSTSAAV